MNYLQKNIAFLIDSKQISSNKLLEITGHNSTGLVAMWKNGTRNMRTDDVVKLANYLNYTIDDLINKDLKSEQSLSNGLKNNNVDELEHLFKKNRDILTKDDEETIRFLIEKRKRDIDKQNHNE